MSIKAWLQLVAFAFVVVLAAGVSVAWEDVRRQQADLQDKLASTQEQLRAADAREETRKTQLREQLAQIAQQQKRVQSPEQIVQALPSVLPLPEPLTVNAVPSAASAGAPAKAGSVQGAPAPKVQLPSEDLKPLYDYALSCKACQDQLSAAQADLKDEKTKTQALGRERDDALRVARGGSVLQRVARAAKWFAIGAVAGAAAAKLAR
jgi:hypothetical protein